MKATIVSFRRGKRTQHTNQMIIKVEGIDSKEKARELLKKNVTWPCSGKKKKEIKGVIKATHGNKGLVRAAFEKGMPGQSLSKEVQLH